MQNPEYNSPSTNSGQSSNTHIQKPPKKNLANKNTEL